MPQVAESEMDREPRLPPGTALLLYLVLALLTWAIVILVAQGLWSVVG